MHNINYFPHIITNEARYGYVVCMYIRMYVLDIKRLISSPISFPPRRSRACRHLLRQWRGDIHPCGFQAGYSALRGRAIASEESEKSREMEIKNECEVVMSCAHTKDTIMRPSIIHIYFYFRLQLDHID